MSSSSFDFASTWATLRPIVDAIMRGENLKVNSDWLLAAHCVYRVSYNRQYITTLYLEMRSILTECAQCIQAGVDVSAQDPNVDILSSYLRGWKLYYERCVEVNRLFRHLNKLHLPSRASLHIEQHRQKNDPHYVVNTTERNLLHYMLDVWRDELSASLKDGLMSSLLVRINEDRSGVEIDFKLVQNVISTFVDGNQMSMYADFFETGYLNSTAVFVKEKTRQPVTTGKYSSYLQKVARMLQDEMTRSEKFLHEQSWSKVQRRIAECMIRDDHISYLQKCLPQVIAEHRIEELQNSCKCLQYTDSGIDMVARVLERHMEGAALSIEELFDDDPTLLAALQTALTSPHLQNEADDSYKNV